MDNEKWSAVPKERKLRLLGRIEELGKRCVDCFEQLTLVERLQGRCYCAHCFPEESMEGGSDDALA